MEEPLFPSPSIKGLGRIVLAAVLPLSLSLAGCGGGGHGGSCTANLQMSWQIDANVTCESVGATAVQVIIDGAASTTSCNGYGTTIGGILPGTHSVQVQLLGAGGTIISDTGAMNVAISSCNTYDLNGGSPIVFATNSCTASLQMSWQIDSNVTCESVGATTVTVILDGVQSTIPCNAYGTTIGGILPGTHNVRVQLSGASGVISDTGAMNVAINSCITYDLNGGNPIVFTTNTSPCTSADLQVSWEIQDTTGATLTCATAPADTVQVILDGTVYPFSCGSYMGTVSNVPLGTHTAQLKLLDNGTSISDTGPMNISLSSCILYDLNGGTPVPFTVN
jgi:hypothetical protein